jgi:isopenicillin-N epimerase
MMKGDMVFGRGLLSHWHLDPDWSHLNHGSFGACPRKVLAAQDRWREQMEQSLVHFMDHQLPGSLNHARTRVGAFLNADPDGLAFVTNASEGVNAVLRSMDLGPSDRLVTTSWAYGAVDQTLRYVCDRSGAVLDPVVLPFPFTDPDELVEAVCRRLKGARLLVLDHIASITAVVLPIEPILAAAKREGVPVLIDGAHAPGQVPVDLNEMQVDYWVGNLHKWCFAPKGSAMLWVAEEHRAAVHPTVISHGLGQGFHEEFDWVGTRDPSAWLSTPDALDFVEALREAGSQVYQDTLLDQATARLFEAWGVRPTAPRSCQAFMATVRWPFPVEPTLKRVGELHDHLYDHYGVEVPVLLHDGQVWLRVSSQVYVDLDDIERLVQALGPSGWKT